MSYYLRAFCTSGDVPPLRAVLRWTEERGIHLQARSADLDTSGWEYAEIAYRSDREPFIVERNLGALVEQEAEEFLELLDSVDDTAEKQAVVRHLARSEAIVSVELLASQASDGLEAAGIFLTYFVDRCGGLVQSDGEGFYDGQRLIVALG